MDYGPDQVRCNVFCLGATRTDILEEALTPLTENLKTDIDGVFNCISSNVPLCKVAAPWEISGICSYLASDDSLFMTGSEILLDGGAVVVDVSGAAITNAGVNWGVTWHSGCTYFFFVIPSGKNQDLRRAFSFLLRHSGRSEAETPPGRRPFQAGGRNPVKPLKI